MNSLVASLENTIYSSSPPGLFKFFSSFFTSLQVTGKSSNRLTSSVYFPLGKYTPPHLVIDTSGTHHITHSFHSNNCLAHRLPASAASAASSATVTSTATSTAVCTTLQLQRQGIRRSISNPLDFHLIVPSSVARCLAEEVGFNRWSLTGAPSLEAK